MQVCKRKRDEKVTVLKLSKQFVHLLISHRLFCLPSISCGRSPHDSSLQREVFQPGTRSKGHPDSTGPPFRHEFSPQSSPEASSPTFHTAWISWTRKERWIKLVSKFTHVEEQKGVYTKRFKNGTKKIRIIPDLSTDTEVNLSKLQVFLSKDDNTIVSLKGSTDIILHW